MTTRYSSTSFAQSSQPVLFDGPSLSGAEPEPSAPPSPQIYALYSWKRSPNARLAYLRDTQKANDEVAKLRSGPLGFDLEWKPSFRKGQKENAVALVQLATEDMVLIIQVSAMQRFPEKLREVLEDADTVKAGVGIQYDCKKLYTDYAVTTRSCVDLSLLARSVDNPRWKGKYSLPIGLMRLCEAYEELTLSKGKVQRSNWEAVLSEQQQEYAANDCHSALTLYNRLSSMALAMIPAPLVEYYTFNYISGRLCNPTTGSYWNPHNPQYDPGPPPPPRPPKTTEDTTDVAEKEAHRTATSLGGTKRTKIRNSRRVISPEQSLEQIWPQLPNNASPASRHYTSAASGPPLMNGLTRETPMFGRGVEKSPGVSVWKP
ncbi:hypothetical protein AcW1_000281 [Taiwanofungus camphoratus]|nr:hypothetical protein AcW2_001223 [Antrodia cinnamomea]KAI0935890.1 hypothetical protein AcV5_004182 [Antrodia cinnamomea]KAI0961114.1 hypothetical protein AcV7_000301 [Antrodia cinnamomea]KAI0963107.1 hypothetical protein AcW1_000281 [Antrodia cinnamomea]